MAAPIVFFDIAGENIDALQSFYASVFNWQFDAHGQFSVPVMAPIDAAIRQDPAEKRLYVGVADVTETMRLVEAAGGSIDQPRFEVPGMVVLGLFRDPAGNPMGLVEMDGDRPRIP